jgi:hypothetical protein
MHYVVPKAETKNYFPVGIRVGTSNVANAGEGLFATKDFATNELICEFPGFWIPTTAVTNTQGRGSMKDHYVFSVCGNTEISYMTHPCPANKINSHAYNEQVLPLPPPPPPPLPQHTHTHTPHPLWWQYTHTTHPPHPA